MKNNHQYAPQTETPPCHRPIAAAVLLWAWSCLSFAGTTYYVSMTGNDSNPGTATNSTWATIQHAVDNVVAGDTILVRTGTYAGAIIGSSGAPGAPITLKAYPGDAVHLNSLGPTGAQQSHQSIILFEGWYSGVSPTYWVLEGFEISAAPRDGVDIRGGLGGIAAHHITIRSNYVHHCGRRGIMTILADDCVAEGNVCAYNTLEHGIYFSDSSKRPIIRNNICHNNNASGIQINAATGGDGDGESSGAVVTGNICYGNGATGGSGINLGGVTHSLIANNLIYSNHNASGIAIYNEPVISVVSHDVTVFNNTITRPNEGTGRWAVNISSNDSTDIVVMNNILLNDSPVDGSINAANPSASGFVSDYNVVVNRFSTDEGDTVHLSLAEWQTTYGHDTNSIIATAEQLFVDVAADDYHLSPTSLAIDVGTFLATVTNDIELLARPQGLTHDAGAYEFPSSLLRITATAHTGGEVSPSGVVLAEPGTNVTFAITSNPGYRTVAVISDEDTAQATNHGAVASYTFTDVQTNHTLDAYFTNIFSVTPIAGTGGTVTPSNTVTVDMGESVAFDVDADTNWHISRFRFDNVAMNAFLQSNRLTSTHVAWSNITANATLEVSFAESIWEQSVPQSWLAGHYPESNDYEGVALTDTDEDTFEAWEEYMTGTDPRDSDSRFRIIDADRNSPSNTIQWLGSNKGSPDPFKIYRSTDLTVESNAWTFRTNYPKSSADTNTWTDPAAASAPLFYRVTVGDAE